VIHAELPGIKPEYVKIEVQDDILTVSGKHEQATEQKHTTTSGASDGTDPSAAPSRSRPASTPTRSTQRPRMASSK
jgi:hypothetical protein